MSFEDILNKVKEHPVLWDPSHKFYRQKAVQADSWDMIALELDIEEKLVKSRWKYLKDHCRKELKKLMAGEIRKSKWQYFDQLEFIREELLNEGKKVQKECKHENDEVPPQKMSKTESPEPSSSYSTGQDTKRYLLMTNKINELSKKIDNQSSFDEELRTDPDFMFLMSILPTIRNLSAVQKFTFRGKVNEWLLEALAQNEFSLSEQYQCKFEVQES